MPVTAGASKLIFDPETAPPFAVSFFTQPVSIAPAATAIMRSVFFIGK